MRGSFRPRGRGSWELTIDHGRDAAGTRHRTYKTVKGTKREAQAALTAELAERNRGVAAFAGRLTLAEYLGQWMRDYASIRVRPATLMRYRSAINRHIVPHLGNIKLRSVRPADIQRTHRTCLEGERLSARTVLHHHRILHEALEHAVGWQLLASNPVDGAQPPRPERAEIQTLNPAQAAALLAAAEGTAIGPIISMALHTGARVGEILGLRWDDIDFVRGRVAIRCTVQRITGNGMVEGPTKTHRSQRPISLAPEYLAELQLHRERQEAEIVRLGDAYIRNNLVFAQALGQHFEPGQIARSFAKLVSKLDLPAIRFHDLRHTHATLLLAQGANPKVVSERLGHATVGLTLDRYSHVLPSVQEEAARSITGLLSAARVAAENAVSE